MKKITITLFAFSELTKEAQQKALTENRTINVPFGWWDHIEQEMESLNIHLKHFEIETDVPVIIGSIKGSCIETATLILEKWAPETLLYTIASEFSDNYTGITGKLNGSDMLSRDHKQALKTELAIHEKHFTNNIMVTFAYLLKAEYYERITDQAVIKTLEEYDFAFERDGRLSNVSGDEQEEHEMPIGILDIGANYLPSHLVEKLGTYKPYVYMDTYAGLNEHLYSPETITEKFQENGVPMNGEECDALNTLQIKMNKLNCGYFRIPSI